MDEAVHNENEASATSITPSVMLTSLAPSFNEDQHQTYLSRLEQAIKEPKNHNIALTGRYGVGKSSVLNRFKEAHSQTTLRLAISTLSPKGDGTTLTNRIQKELVKQIVYSASPDTLRHSQFRRRIPFSWKRSTGEAATVVGLIGAFLAFMGWLPAVVGTSLDHHWFLQGAAWLGLAAVMIVALVLLRWVTHERFMVSGVSAGGATVKLSKRAPTYFDEYLEDIVNYFDTEDIRVVIFEDLDRFDDPQIFEALRELNTLLNNTKKRTESGAPLRFVYAVRDSLFEKLGTDTETGGEDAVNDETVRANRTKFFDLVIPMVPFISHRNARELLTDLLENAGITGIDRRLVNLVAQHSTDMRLLHNMANEYLVFAERLLESDKVAPGLAPSNLFALVVYKNFHLEDFENIARRTSDLDRLYDFRRKLVRKSIAERERRKRALASREVRLRTRAGLAQKLANRLLASAKLAKNASRYFNYVRLYFRVDDRDFSADDLSSYDFWQVASQAKTLTLLASQGPANAKSQVISFDQPDLAALAPEGMNPDRWNAIDEEATRREVADIDPAIAFLRGSDFADLAGNPNYTLPVTVSADARANGIDETAPISEVTEVERTFGELVDETLKSELARNLVKRGYIDRNFALYAAQFYGSFTGIDVANFMVQNVQTNTMELDYPFSGPDAVANLLLEADEDFTFTVAAYNVDVVNYLLDTGDRRVANIVGHLATEFDEDARTFLTAYVTSGAHPDKLVAHLALHPWREILVHLVTNDDVPDDGRSDLVNAALSAVDPDQTYELGQGVSEFIYAHYHNMAVFTGPQDPNIIANLAALLDRAKILIPDIGALDDGLRALIVSSNRYELTASNLHHALDNEGTDGTPNGISLDRVSESKVVYEYCLAHADDYLAAVEADETTPHTILGPQTLINTVADVVDTWGEKQLVDLIRQAAPNSSLENLTSVATSVWPVLADADHFRVSLANIERYREEVGSIDEHLGKLLENAKTIHTEEHADTIDESGEEFDREGAAIAILNSAEITEPAARVALARSLNADLSLRVGDIKPEVSGLFALLLENNLIADDVESFNHFHEAGWPAIGPAIAVSDCITDFVTPALVQGMVADLLNDRATRGKIGTQVVSRVDDFVPDDDSAALSAVAQYADNQSIALKPETVVRIAHAGNPAPQFALRLLGAATPEAQAHHIFEVFSTIGPPYNTINQARAQFDVDRDELHEALLTTLQNDNICTFRKKRHKDLYSVNVT